MAPLCGQRSGCEDCQSMLLSRHKHPQCPVKPPATGKHRTEPGQHPEWRLQSLGENERRTGNCPNNNIIEDLFRMMFA